MSTFIKNDSHNFQVYQYESRNMMTNKEGDFRLPTVREREVVMGFDEGYTSAALPPKCSKFNEEVIRCSVLGNSFHVFSISFLITELLKDCYGKDFQLPTSSFCWTGISDDLRQSRYKFGNGFDNDPEHGKNLYSSILGERSEGGQTLDWTRRSPCARWPGPDRALEAVSGSGR